MKKLTLAFLLAAPIAFSSLGYASKEESKPAASVVTTAVKTPLAEMPAGKYDLDPIHFSVTWSVKHMEMMNYVGRFTRVEATLDLDPKDPTKSGLVVKIDPKSLLTDYSLGKEHTKNEKYIKRDFEKELIMQEQWFNSEKFPEITFVVKKIEKINDKAGVMHGDLTFLGVTKPIKLDVVYNASMLAKPYDGRPVIGFSAKGKINRADFGQKTIFDAILSNEVELMIEAEFLKKA
ncbi:MAG: polyisoprenoid-binding protein [Alphaproteobacteria bacterium]|nr:polyisoprenoid-binding protein [Alphaproteobacteria bacterium]